MVPWVSKIQNHQNANVSNYMTYTLALRPEGLTLHLHWGASLLKRYTQFEVQIHFFFSSRKFLAVIRFSKGFYVSQGIISGNGLSRLLVPKGQEKGPTVYQALLCARLTYIIPVLTTG